MTRTKPRITEDIDINFYPKEDSEEKIEEFLGINEEEVDTDSDFGKDVKEEVKKTAYKVYRNEGKELVLEDNRGCGIRIPTPEQYKNVKKDDIVYI